MDREKDWEFLVVDGCYTCRTEKEFFCDIQRGHKGPYQEIVVDANSFEQKITWEKINDG